MYYYNNPYSNLVLILLLCILISIILCAASTYFFCTLQVFDITKLLKGTTLIKDENVKRSVTNYT